MVRLALIALLASCTNGVELGNARAEAAPHIARFTAFDHWARRLDLADPSFSSDEALAETAFAPLRGERGVAAAWLEREGADPRALSWPDSAPPLPRDGWTRVRLDDVGEMETRHMTLAGHDVLLLRRSRPVSATAILHVTMAF